MFERFLRRPSVGQGLLDIGRGRGADILRLIHAGWERSLAAQNVHPEMGEVQMTCHLREGMIGAVNDRAVRSARKLSVLPGTESWRGKNSVRPDGLTDISIHLRDVREKLGDHGPHAIIECKRVEGSSTNLCREYVVEGIDRFIDQKYSAKHAAAFMAGYLLSPDAEAAALGINKYLSGRGRTQDQLESCTVLGEPWARSSHHLRPNPATPIDLHHAFLEFPKS